MDDRKMMVFKILVFVAQTTTISCLAVSEVSQKLTACGRYVENLLTKLITLEQCMEFLTVSICPIDNFCGIRSI